MRLWFDFGIADVQYWPAKLHAADPSFINLIEVRVEVSIVADAEAEPQARRGLRGAGIDAPAKPTWTEDGCRIWFQRRVASHPKGEPSPTERDCLAAAHADFDGHIPRDKFRAIRGGETPASWRRPGPRGPRRPRD